MNNKKFRVWDSVKCVMIYPNEKGIFDTDFNDPFVIGGNGNLIYSHGEYDVDRVELMQYTGLKDKNAKNIYEGDIVKYTHPHKGEKVCSVIYFEGGGFKLIVDPPSGFVVRIGNYSSMSDQLLSRECEIIGNKYENPELLEESKNV